MPWDSVPCHPTVRKTILRAIQRDRFGRTSLIYGPAGAGQAAVARAIVLTLVCQQRTHDFCGQCSTCLRIAQGVYPDVIEMYPSGDWSKAEKKTKERKKHEYSIDHMRMVQEQAVLLPFEGSHKYYIIHDAHSMNHHTANSLLKILEEPHPHLMFLLLTDQAAGILPTIRSRCWGVRLIPLEEKVLAQSLQTRLSPGQALTIARAAGGLPEQAELLLSEAYLEKRDQILEMLEQIKERESAVVEAAERIAKDRDGMKNNLSILLRLVRDGVVSISVSDSDQYENPDRCEEMGHLWNQAALDGLQTAFKKILKAVQVQERFVNPTILMTDIFLQLREVMTAE